MTPLVASLIAYSIGLIALGLWMGRRVRDSQDFFVASRSLGPGLIFSTFLAANIGAGSTVGATGYAYTDGLAAWWWNGSAGLGSLVLAIWVGPRIWREANRLGLVTVGDFLERHFGRRAGLAALIIWFGSFAILCVGSAARAVPSAWRASDGHRRVPRRPSPPRNRRQRAHERASVNRIQLVIILLGFAIAAPMVSNAAGGFAATTGNTSFWHGERVGWQTMLLLGPAFFLSPGLLQKAFGARDERAVRIGVGVNGVALLLFAWLPVALGLAARVLHPGLARPEMALPAVLAANVPTSVGAFALAAVFSAELSTADAVLFMLATSGARDFYRGFIRTSASDTEVLRVARILAVVGCLVGYSLTFVFDSVVSALTMFYSVMIGTLFAPILGGLFLPHAGRWSALASMLVGVATLITTHVATGGAGYVWVTPSFLGLIASGVTYLILAVF